MDVTTTSRLSAMAASVDGSDDVRTLMLKKALDQQSSSVAQLLQALPQKDGAGNLVDVQA